MAHGPVDPDQYTAPFQLTKGMYRDVYPAVDPKNEDLKATGKVVIITGAGGGLGEVAAQAWSLAGAAGIVLVGRTASTLERTAQSLQVPSLVATGNVVSESDAKSIFEQAVAKFGKVDVLINAAGTINAGANTGLTEPSQWFKDIETNVKGTYNMCYYFIKATEGKGTIINVVTMLAASLSLGFSSYACSKLAVIKLTEFLDFENSALRVFSVHPGALQAEEGRGMLEPQYALFAKDKPLLFGGLSLYLQKPQSDFLRGGFLSVNWDVEELEAHKDEITEKKLVKLGFLNGELKRGGYSWLPAEAEEKKKA